jgi:hypothetical protein
MVASDIMAGTMLGILAAALAAAGTARADAPDPKVRADLESLARRSVYFGHQSVGWNIIDGLKALSAREGVPLRIEEVKGRLEVPPGTFAHGPVAENGKPDMKLASFTSALGSGVPSPAEVAFMKFCYVDFNAGTDAASLFARYQSTLADLKARNPGTTFVHVTVPLTTAQGGWKAIVKRAMGKTPGGYAENARRQEFNDLMRRTYQGKEPLFDLAAVESTAPDGSRAEVEWEGKMVPVLFEGYTDDGGHLDKAGQLRAARELLAALARLPAPPAGGK